MVVPSNVVRCCLCWGRISLGANQSVELLERWDSIMTLKSLFSAKHPAPCWLGSPDVMLRTADSRSISERVCHVSWYLLEMSAWCLCLSALSERWFFFPAVCITSSQNFSAFCLVWILGGSIWEVPGEKGIWASIVKTPLWQPCRRVFHYLCSWRCYWNLQSQLLDLTI